MLTRTRLSMTACAVLIATGALPLQSADAGTRVLKGLPYVAKPARAARPDAAKGRVKSSPDEAARRARRASRRVSTRLVKPSAAPPPAARRVAARGRSKTPPDEAARRARRASRRVSPRLVKPPAAPPPATPTGPAPNVLASQAGLGPTSGVNPSDVGAAIGPEYF